MFPLYGGGGFSFQTNNEQLMYICFLFNFKCREKQKTNVLIQHLCINFIRLILNQKEKIQFNAN